jgi:DNA-binding transcriptional ArsR family regulator
MTATAKNQAPTIASEPILEGPSTDSTSEVVDPRAELHAELAARAAEIRQLRLPDIREERKYACRGGRLKPFNGPLKVYDYLVAMTAGYQRWSVPNDKRPQALLLRDIADAIGMSKKSVSRGIAKLEDLRLVHVDRHSTAGSGTSDGATYTLLVPEAQAWRGRKPVRRELAAQEKLDVNPPWVIEALTASSDVVGCDMKPAAEFVLRLQRNEGLTDNEMVAWIRRATETTAASPRKNAMGYFRRTLEGLMRERGGLRIPEERQAPSSPERETMTDEAFERAWGA